MMKPEPIETTSRDVVFPDRMDALHVFALLRRSVAAAGGQRSWAHANKISPSFLNDVLNSRRDVSPTILAALGLRRVTYFERVSRGSLNEPYE